MALAPEAVRQFKVAGHEVRVETQAGVGAGFSDEEYVNAGAGIVSVSDAWDSDLVTPAGNVVWMTG